jgi:succinyl-CoA synthetase beta subunit
MKIYEYQAKDLFAAYGIPVPRGYPARTPEEAGDAAARLGSSPVVLKAQVHAGGRGKGGGIKVVEDAGQVASVAAAMLGTRLVTPQTGPEGKPVNALLVEEGLTIHKEIYIGIVIDRRAAAPVVIASGEGGMDIEKVAAEAPDKVITEPVDPAAGLRPFQAMRIAYGVGLEGPEVRLMSDIVLRLYRLFTEKDCSHVEINPLVNTGEGKLLALDAKINLDDNALFRHKDLAALKDESQEDPLEVEASRYNLNYIKLKGNVGCMVNGAGLAMATMDLIKHIGAEPANFLDVGGGATSGMITQGLKILVSDPDVRVVLINIFGGILRCDTLARGVTEAVKQLSITLPVVVRLEGTNVEVGRRILADSGLNFSYAATMGEAAEQVRALLQRV